VNKRSAEEIFKSIKLLGSDDIRSYVSMKEAIDVMAEAFSSYSSGHSKVPQRYVSGISGSELDIFFKPAYDKRLDRIAVKILTQKRGGSLGEIPAILGVVLLLDMNTGAILSMIDGAYLTALRTGAASGIATKLLAREDAAIIAVFGCGTQGKTQLEAICNIRPIKQALLYDININAAEDLKSTMAERLGISIRIEQKLQNLKQADIICTATNSIKPLFSRNDLNSGVHINAIGSYKPEMQELDPHIIESGILFADSREAVLKESGDLIKPLKDGVFSENIIRGEIGDVINNNVRGRETADDITIFKSVGLGVQDLFIANLIYNKSKGD